MLLLLMLLSLLRVVVAVAVLREGAAAQDQAQDHGRSHKSFHCLLPG
jgi:hypothetical protein